MDLNNTELYILVSLERKGLFEVKEVSALCDIDKTTCYKAINTLEKCGLVLRIDSNPLKYAVNYDKINGIN
jgi:predicted transcriptional regulator